MSATLNLTIKPDWEEVETVRTRSADFLREHGLPGEAIDALSMVACELTENAVKYGHYTDQANAAIGVEVSLESDTVTVEVKSPVRSRDAEGLSRLDTMIQWIRGHQDPFEAYLSRLQEVSVQDMESRESGLGLVRIAYEGQSVLDFFVDDRNVVSVSAVYTLGRGASETATPGALR